MASRYSDRDRTLALAGLLQAARTAQTLAWRGEADEAALRASLASVFVEDPGQTAEVFGGLAGVRAGLELVQSKFGERGEPEDMELARYVLALTQLAERLRANRETLQELDRGLARLRADLDSGDIETMVEGLAELYTQTLSTLPPRILVNGEPQYLHDADTVARVRAVLLAGVRAADLWRQVEGRQWQLVFFRKRFARIAGALLKEGES